MLDSLRRYELQQVLTELWREMKSPRSWWRTTWTSRNDLSTPLIEQISPQIPAPLSFCGNAVLVPARRQACAELPLNPGILNRLGKNKQPTAS